MLRLLAGLLVIVLALAAAALLAGVVQGAGIPRCEDREAVAESDADECFETSSGGKTIGLVLGAAAGVVAALGAVAGVGYVRRRGGGGRLVLCTLATPILALAALLFVQISF